MVHVVAAEYPQSTLEGTPTYSSNSGTVSYDIYIAGQKESVYVGVGGKEGNL